MNMIKKFIVAILTWESRLILQKYKPFVIAVTGSVGKTSTKDAIYEAIKGHGGYVRKSDKSMNSEIGLPLTIIGVPNAWRSVRDWLHNLSEGARLVLRRSEYPDCLIVEVGADHPGDIERVASWLRPDIAVITKVSDTPVHVEFFSSPAQVFAEKSFLAKAVKQGGTLVLFADDPKVAGLAALAAERGATVLTYGTDPVADVRGSGGQTTYLAGDTALSVPTGYSFNIDSDGEHKSVAVSGILGDAAVYSLLAAVAVARARGISLADACESLEAYSGPRGRMNIIEGANGTTLIDDTYNSSPDAAIAALAAMKSLQCSGRRIAMLGDMMELGKYSADEHRKVGAVASLSVQVIVAVGMRSRALAEEAIKRGMDAGAVKSFDTPLEAAAYVSTILSPGDVILAKGSQSVRMERAVKALMLHPEHAVDLLVRQEPEWENR